MDLYSDSDFLSFLESGKAEIGFTMQSYVYNSNEKLFDLLDFDNPLIFTEPLLFSSLKQTSNLPLEQILYGYIDDSVKPEKVNVLTDKNGLVYIPKIGYFKTNKPSELLVMTKTAPLTFTITKEDTVVNYDFYRPIYAGDSKIEVYRYHIQQFEKLYEEAYIGEKFEQPDAIPITDKLVEEIDDSLNIIQNHCPDFYSVLSQISRGIEFFNYPTDKMYSFAGVEAHGVVFLNNQEDNNEIFIITEIAHQFAHCILNTILFNKEDYFKINFMTPMKELSGVQADQRSFYDAIHGFFTTFSVGYTLNILLRNNLFNGEKRYELLGRFMDNSNRINSGIEKCNVEKILTPQGLKLFNLIKESLADIYKDQYDVINTYNLTNQPFVFNYKLFKEKNPLRVLS